MAKPIKLTDDILRQLTEEFIANVKGAKMSDGKVSYSKSFTYEGDDVRATVLFEPVAYAKMLLLLDRFDSEVAWHGTVERLAEDCFVIKDIFVYPQEVSGATVNTDQEGYTKWLIGLDNEVANKLHMQGHSHVRMGTSPSAVDLTHQGEILEQIGDDGYYIFMIFNKRLEHTIKIYDFASNTLYEDADISIGIAGDGNDLESFIKDAKDVVKTKVYTTTTTNYGGGTYSGNAYGGSYSGGTQYGSGSTKAPAAVSGVKVANKSSGTDAGKKGKDKADAPKKKRGRPAQGQIGFQTVAADEDDEMDYDAYIFGSRRKYA